MKKIMFNDRYGLTQAVLDGRKTMTRRKIKCPRTFKDIEVSGFRIAHNANGDWYTYLVDNDEREIDGSYLKPTYKIGEVVAIAQSYEKLYDAASPESIKHYLSALEGWDNKMYVKAELMRHHIRITNIRVERLQDISNEDCLREGIRREKFGDSMHYYFERNKGFYSAKDAFSILIDKVSGKGTWSRNPYVFVYEFELVD